MTSDNSEAPSRCHAEAVPPIEDWNRLLDGRVVVVTGGGDGIGGAITRLFAQHGARVEVAEIDPERAARIGAEVGAAGGVIGTHVLDVTDDDDVARLADAVLNAHGRVDVLVNNVGDYRPLVPFERSTAQSWQQMYDINLRHIFAVTRAFLPAMIDSRRGSIVNVHSVEGMRGYPKDPVYGAMKAAAAHFTTCLAVDVGRYGIRVNGIGSDLTQTPQVDYLTGYEDAEHLWASWAPVGRLGWPEDQARVALFLASDQSAYVTGHNVPVDGGTKAGGGWLFSPREGRFVNRSRNL
ncbi:SDR family NAD(P)-dependent oxidoreductase [Mycolicibacterium sarraceniae]|nr:SDR family oxidoreductase [Mycolicibacterium sarraceniae]